MTNPRSPFRPPPPRRAGEPRRHALPNQPDALDPAQSLAERRPGIAPVRPFARSRGESLALLRHREDPPAAFRVEKGAEHLRAIVRERLELEAAELDAEGGRH